MSRDSGWKVTTLAVALGLVLSVFGSALAAEAASPTLTGSSGVYDCVKDTTYCTTSRATLKVNQVVTMVCWEDGRKPPGYQYPRWFYVKAATKDANGKAITVEGFVKAERVKNQTVAKHCKDPASTSIKRVMVGRWAIDRIGKVAPSKDDYKRLAALRGTTVSATMDWMVEDWSGDCVSFARLAWDSVGYKLGNTGNAIDVYKYYRDVKKSIKTDKRPPRGALVFWNATSGGVNFGHVAVSLGNGRVAGTKGWDGNGSKNAAQAIWSAGYLGWTLP